MSIDFKTLVPQGLELLGSALSATGVGAAPGAVLSGIGELVGHVLGVAPTAANIQASLQSLTPEQQAALLTLQENNKVQLQQAVLTAHTAQLQIQANEQAAELADKASARSRDIAIINAGKSAGQNWRADAMLLCAFGAVIVICVLLATGHVAEASAAGGFLITVGGMFARNIGTAFDFEFGSSRSSKDKDATILSQAAAAATPGTKS
jgi:hypothetical protein